MVVSILISFIILKYGLLYYNEVDKRATSDFYVGNLYAIDPLRKESFYSITTTEIHVTLQIHMQ